MEQNIDTVNKFTFLRDTRFLPLAEKFNFEQWLNNFEEGEERNIAKRILDFFIFIPDSMLNAMLSAVIGSCGSFFKDRLENWTDADFQKSCYYSFMPGEDNSSTDSGYVFNRKLRDELRIPEKMILSFDCLLGKLSKEKNKNVILVDDFVGSGTQAISAWNNDRNAVKKSMRQLVEDNHHLVVYAPLIANCKGVNAIKISCIGLELKYVHYLDLSYSLFERSCPCWNNQADIFNKGVKLIIDKSLKLGIKNKFGLNANDLKGYDNQGLAIAFEHGMPDACPPIFYWETDSWKPLIKKYYRRG